MKRALLVLAVFFAATCATASAQDSRSVVQAAAAHMGATNLKTIQITGSGFTAAFGQSYRLTDDFPRFEVPVYTKVIDYDGRASREEYTRRQGSYPPVGGGFTPLQGEPRTVALVNGNFAWNMDGANVIPQPGKYLAGMPMAEVRQLEIIMTPHGFLKAALASSTLNSMTQRYAGTVTDGTTDNWRQATVISITALGKYRVNATINDRNEVELVTTWIPTPFYGDTIYEIRYINYKDFGGVRFPTVMHAHIGDPIFNQAHNTLDVQVSDVKANVPMPAMTVPEAVKTATVPAVRAAAQKLVEGVYLIGGGSHNSVAVEFKDFVTVIEAPLDEERSLAVIEAVTKTIPNKEIRYVVNTHHHFDHSGGLRTYVSQGAVVVATPANLEFYRTVMLYPMPRTLQPDRMAIFAPMNTNNRSPWLMEPVHSRYVISDGTRTLELHPVVGNPHAVGMLMAYLPAEKILINADLFTPPAPNAPMPAATPSMRNLMTNIRRLKLDVAQHVPLHGAPGPHEALVKIAGGGGQ